ncbi:flagellar biosynthesis/type III secretory pathway protein [Burkholderia sp. Ch1-1]|uniref:Flagellar biosynthesis/type III secretory pathway protein n=1 Tax=Paraburkholderia dioscoreae TaxID=2604047 RepID=A0A5Q4ZBY2_9BURK|nr:MULTISPECIES: FliH/SctL family protein [Paraburkholderia]EIF32302.1 flagellar biosynthesis/type III secretory pathway protein [Burkholderia sp. Ch1-1]MDR8402044.1 FliH/SctL family protein [Paraburkholderia sp. USG1]VVD27875.1 Flagellar biosynthesis/type III secretory pathway protein [Paraburkholderia dioscoreae]
MLICRMGAWRIESDGHLSAHELASLDGLRAVDSDRAAELAHERRRLARQVRELKRRAWRRGRAAGTAAALREQVGHMGAAAFAAHRIEDRLTQIVLSAVSDIVGQLPPSAVLSNQLRRALMVAQSQRLVSVRVAPADFDDAVRLIATLEQELGAPLCSVLADVGLPAHACVVETESGVIDGGLKIQLPALERGIRDSVAALLREYDFADGSGHTALDMVGHGVRQTLAALAAPLSTRASPSTPSVPSAQPPLPNTVRVFRRPLAREVG